MYPIPAKSIEPVPMTLAVMPSNSLVVAWPRMRGPTTLKTTEAMAQTSAMTSAMRSWAR